MSNVTEVMTKNYHLKQLEKIAERYAMNKTDVIGLYIADQINLVGGKKMIHVTMELGLINLMIYIKNYVPLIKNLSMVNVKRRLTMNL